MILIYCRESIRVLTRWVNRNMFRRWMFDQASGKRNYTKITLPKAHFARDLENMNCASLVLDWPMRQVNSSDLWIFCWQAWYGKHVWFIWMISCSRWHSNNICIVLRPFLTGLYPRRWSWRLRNGNYFDQTFIFLGTSFRKMGYTHRLMRSKPSLSGHNPRTWHSCAVFVVYFPIIVVLLLVSRRLLSHRIC